MKRSMILVTLITLFVAMVVGIVGCGLSTDIAGDSLTSAAGGGNGPGSGNWQPQKPQNRRQYRLLHRNLNQLMDTTVRLGEIHTEMVLTCYDKEGKRILNSDNPLCDRPILELEAEISQYFVDYIAGYQVFMNCDCSHLGSETLELPEIIGTRSLIIEAGKPTIKMPTSPSARYWSNYEGLCCLTCTHKLDGPVYAFIDLDVDIDALAAQ